MRSKVNCTCLLLNYVNAHHPFFTVSYPTFIQCLLLQWIGFSNDLTLTVMDSGGMLSMLNKSAGWQWTPMLDTLGKKKSEDDSFWPVSVLDGKLLCVPLKGGHEHPDATRRPITTALDLRMPMANSGFKKRYEGKEFKFM